MRGSRRSTRFCYLARESRGDRVLKKKQIELYRVRSIDRLGRVARLFGRGRSLALSALVCVVIGKNRRQCDVLSIHVVGVRDVSSIHVGVRIVGVYCSKAIRENGVKVWIGVEL